MPSVRTLWFTPAEVRALLGLRNQAALERLIASGVLESDATDHRSGGMLFSLAAIKRAAKVVLPGPEQPEQASR